MTEGMRSPITHPDRRYWRRRANRRVRKARLTRGAFRWSVILTLNVLLVAVIALAVSRAHWILLSTDEFALQKVELIGTERVAPERVRERLQPYLKSNLLDLDLAHIAQAAASAPGVLEASAKRVLPHTLRVELVERTPCAVASIGGIAHLIDTMGFVLGPAGSQSASEFPLLTGLEGLEDPALIQTLRRGASMVEQLQRSAPDWLDGVAELNLARSDRVEVRTHEPGPVIALDPRRIERNLNRYFSLEGAIARRVGGADYVDLRWQDRISVIPAPGTLSQRR